MRSRFIVASLLSLSILAFSAIAQDKPNPESKKPDVKATTKPALLPEVALADVTLPDVIDYLREIDPTFQAVVAYGPGADPNSPPVVRHLKLRNVSTQDVLEVLGQVLPFVTFEKIDSNGGPIVMVRVNADPNGPEPAAPRESTQPSTTIHPLRAIIDNMVRDAVPHSYPVGEEKQFFAAMAEKRKQARDAVLSLVQTAIQTEGAKTDVTLKVHEPTETLIFKGTQREAVLVQGALDALAPQAEEPASAADVKAMREELRQLRGRLATIAGMYGEPPVPPTTRPAGESAPKR